jgi:ABC-2 type transport system ATP-binding protein
VREITGYAGQDTERSAYLRLTARENLIFFAHAFRGISLREAAKRIDDISDQLDFGENLGKQFSPMSGGEKQLVVLIRSLLHYPRVLILDEPSKNLDPVTSRKVRNFIRSFAREHGTTVLLTTHNMAEADELCERFAFIHKGELRFSGTPKEFKSAVTVHEVVEVNMKGDRDRAIGHIERLPGVNNVVSDKVIRIYCNRAIDVLPEICVLLKTLDPKAVVKTREPSLEDAYSIFVDGSKDREI